jgi:glycosyltransferase involved in cell wall biosynthesis
MRANVLHHAALPHRGGAVRVARLLAEAQKAAGRDVLLSYEVAENDPEAGAQPNAAQDEGISLLGPTPPGELGRTLAAQPGETTLHLHTSTDWTTLLGGLAACTGRVVLTLHDAMPLTGGCAYPLDCPHFPVCADPCPREFADARARQAAIAGLLGALARRTDLTLASPSRWLAGLARQALPELPVRVIPNGVPWPTAAELPAKALARAVLGVAPGAPMALFAAHGGARAGYKAGPQWLEFWQALHAAVPGAVAFAVGGDELGGQDGLTFWPYVDRAKLRLLMRAADVLLYPTLADNHPLVLLEAAAAELPVVSFAVGGVPEIVVHGETGLLATADEGPEFLRAARDMLSDPALCRRLGRAARAHGSRRFAAGRMAADYAALEG